MRPHMKGREVDEDRLQELLDAREKTRALYERKETKLVPTMYNGYNENMTIREVEIKPSTYEINDLK